MVFDVVLLFTHEIIKLNSKTVAKLSMYIATRVAVSVRLAEFVIYCVHIYLVRLNTPLHCRVGQWLSNFFIHQSELRKYDFYCLVGRFTGDMCAHSLSTECWSQNQLNCCMINRLQYTPARFDLKLQIVHQIYIHASYAYISAWKFTNHTLKTWSIIKYYAPLLNIVCPAFP